MSEGDIATVLDSLEFESSFCAHPSVVHVSGDIYAVAFTGESSDGWVATFSVNAAGEISNSIIDSDEFDGVYAPTPCMFHIAGDKFGISYNDSSTYIRIITITILSDGTISFAGADNQVIEGAWAITNRTVHVAGTIYATVFTVLDGDGWVVTTDITDGGVITTTAVDRFEFEPDICVHPEIIHIVGTHCAIAYAGPSAYGKVVTITIDLSGNIGASITDSLIFYSEACDYFSFVNIKDEFYAVVFVGAGSDGFLITFTISNAGLIGNAIIDSFEFAAGGCGAPKIAAISGIVYAICYYVPTNQGYVQTLNIANDGVIDTSPIDTYRFSVDFHTIPSMVHVSGDVYLVAFPDASDLGQVNSIGIETASPGMNRHELLLGIG